MNVTYFVAMAFNTLAYIIEYDDMESFHYVYETR